MQLNKVYRVTELPELCPPLEAETEAECILSNSSVNSLNCVVVLEQLEHVTIRLPEELDPRRDQYSVTALLCTLTTHSAQQEATKNKVITQYYYFLIWKGTIQWKTNFHIWQLIHV